MGINLYSGQSPPPITFPALADAIEIFDLEKKDLTYEFIAISAAAFDAL